MAELLYLGTSSGTVNTAMWEWGLYFAPISTVVDDPVHCWTVSHDIFYSDPAGGGFPFLQFMRPGQMVLESRVYRVDVATERRECINATPYTNVGFASGANMPPACSIMALWRPADNVSRVRGRTFLPPFSTAILNGGDADPGTTGHVGFQLRKMASFMASVGYTPVIRSRATHISHQAVLQGVSNHVNWIGSRAHAMPIRYSG